MRTNDTLFSLLGHAAQIHEELVNVEGKQALSISTIRRWIAIFKDGEEEIKDKARFGRPRKANDIRQNCQGRGYC